jgi:hypothetical protein
MQLEKVGSLGNGSNHSPQTSEYLATLNPVYLEFTNNLLVHVKHDRITDHTEIVKLDTLWNYHVFYGGGQLFHYHSSQEYILSETDIASTTEQLRSIILQTYAQHQASYENHKLSVLPLISALSGEIVEKWIIHLQQILVHQFGVGR